MNEMIRLVGILVVRLRLVYCCAWGQPAIPGAAIPEVRPPFRGSVITLVRPPLRGSAIRGVSHLVTNPIHVRESRGPRVPGLRVPGVHESLDPFPLLGGCRKKAASVEVSISLAFLYGTGPPFIRSATHNVRHS